MLKKKWLRVVGGVVLGGGSMAMAAIFAWDDSASGNWSDQTEWNSIGCPADCYPHTTNDDASIATDGVTITLTESVTIDDLTFSGDATSAMGLKAIGSTGRVIADSIIISGTSVQLTDLAALKADGTNPCE